MQTVRKEISRAVGHRVRNIRRQLCLNQKEFAAGIGMANTYLSEIEAGKNGPGLNFLFQLTKHYNINPLYLLHGQEPLFFDEQEPKRPSPKTAAQENAFGENTRQIREMLEYFQRSPMVKFTMLGFFSKDIAENKALIDEDIERNKSTPCRN